MLVDPNTKTFVEGLSLPEVVPVEYSFVGVVFCVFLAAGTTQPTLW